MSNSLNYKYISPHILEIAWPAEIQENILLDMMGMKEMIINQWKEELWDVILGYHHLSLHFQYPIEVDEVLSELEGFYRQIEKQSSPKRKRWYIPVYYNGRDMDVVSQITGKSNEKIIELHQNKNYLLHFYGFMPGFMYLGGLDASLFAARKEKPDPLIEKGSVAIGGKQTGIYPMDSPGGWNIIGKTPIALFDLKTMPPVFANPGDQIRFYSISLEEFEAIEKKIKQQNFELKNEDIHG